MADEELGDLDLWSMSERPRRNSFPDADDKLKMDAFLAASLDRREEEKLEMEARKGDRAAYLDLARDIRDADKSKLDNFLAAKLDRRNDDKLKMDVNRANVELLKQLEAMRLDSEKDRREAERSEYYVDYERGLGAINYHQRKTDLEKSRYQLDAVINQNYTESNRKEYFEFDKAARGTRFAASNLKCDPEIKRDFMAAWNSTFSEGDWRSTFQKLLELSDKAVSNSTTFKQYLNKLKPVMPERERVARMADRQNFFAFQTGPKFPYTFRPIPDAVMSYDSSEDDYRETPRGTIYVDKATSDFFVADMLEFLNTVLRFPAGSVYPTRFDRVGLSTPNGNIVVLDWSEALEYGFYKFGAAGGLHKRTITLTENTELMNVYLHTIRFDATGRDEPLVRLPGKETIRKIIGDNVGGELTHAPYIRAVVRAVEEYASKKADERFNALSAVDVLVTYLRYIFSQEKMYPRGTDFRDVVRKLKLWCPKIPCKYVDSYAVITGVEDGRIMGYAREILIASS